jgi:uncharacterized RDD family membrane protein YckC
MDQEKPKERLTESHDIFEIMGHKVRRQIISLLHESIEMSYTELIKSLKIDEGLLNFHLRKMKQLLEQTEQNTYTLSPQGKISHDLIHRLESKLAAAVTASHVAKQAPKLAADILIRRITAWAIDTLAIFVLTGLVLESRIWVFVTMIITLNVSLFDFADLMYLLLHTHGHVILVAFGTYTAMEAYKGQTLGKYVTRIRVVKADGRKLSPIESLIRNVGKVFLFPLDIGIGLIFFTRYGYLKFFDFYTDAVVEKTDPS